MAEMIAGKVLDTAFSNRGSTIHRSLLSVVVGGVVLASACLVWSPIEAGGQSPTIDFSVHMEMDEIWIDPRPGQKHTATNNLIIKNYSIHTLTIMVEASCGIGLDIEPMEEAVDVNPQGGGADPPYSVELQVRVTSPWDSSKRIQDCTVYPNIISVDGMFPCDGNYRGTGFQVHFLPDPRVEISIPDTTSQRSVRPGDEFILPVRVYNHGILDDDIQVGITNLRELEAQGWRIERPTQVIWEVHGRTPYLLADRSAPYHLLYLRLRAPESWLGWKDESYRVELTATSKGWGIEDVTSNTSVSIQVKGLSYPSWSALAMLESVVLVAMVMANRRLRRQTAEWLSPDLISEEPN